MPNLKAIWQRAYSYAGSTPRLALVILVLLGVVYVLWPRVFPNTTYGRIFIDSPEVYTRERLVNDRFVQDAWLRDRLAALEDVKLAADSGVKSSGSFQGAVAIAPAAGDAPPSPPKPEPPAGGQAAAPNALDGFFARSEGYRLQNTLREQIRQDIIENQLDDRHDLAGNKLYMLKFDASVIPGENTSDSAIVQIDAQPVLGAGDRKKAINWEDEIRPPDDADPSERPWRKFYERWQRDLESRLNEQVSRCFDSLSGKPSTWLISDFVDYYDTYKQTAPSDPGVSTMIDRIGDAVRNVPESAGAGSLAPTVESPAALFAHLVSDPQSWRKARLAIDMFCVRNALQAILGSSSEPRYWLKSEWLMEQTATGVDFRGKINAEVGAGGGTNPFLDLSLFEGAVRLELDLGETFLFSAEFIQTSSPRSPPRISVLDRTIPFSMIEGRCLGAIRDVTNAVNFYQNHSYVGSESVDGSDMRTLIVAGLKWDLRGERHFVIPAPQPSLTQISYFSKALGKRTPSDLAAQLSPFFPGDLISALAEFPNDKGIAPTAPPTKKLEALFPVCKGTAVQPVALSGYLPVGFINFASELTSERPYSYAVLPRYDAAIEELQDQRDYGFSGRVGSGWLSNLFGGGGVDARSGSSFAGLRARTSLVGFGTEVCRDEDTDCSGREPRFGWVISPKQRDFGITETARMSSTQRSLAALLSVPAWWEALSLRVCVGWMDRAGGVRWVNDDGEFIGLTDTASDAEPETGDTPKQAKRNPSCEPAFEYSVILPRDFEAADDIVFNKRVRGPQMSSLDIDDGPITISACSEASFEIPGQRLWRSAVVTLAGQSARKIEVLPNMRGIIATFSPFTSVQEKVENATLTVWTSEGSAQYPRAITIIRTAEDGKACVEKPP